MQSYLSRHSIRLGLANHEVSRDAAKQLETAEAELAHSNVTCHTICHTTRISRSPATVAGTAAAKLEAAEAELAHSGRMGRFAAPFDKRGKDDQKLAKLCRDTGKLAVEQIKGISSQARSGPTA